MINKCQNCNNIFIIPRKKNRYKNTFCSRKCYLEAIKKDKTLHPRFKGRLKNYTCIYCGKIFERRPHNTIPKYCSLSCSAKHRGENHRGENNHNWKGGIGTRYLKKIAPRPRPDICEICGRKGKKRNGIVLDHNHRTKEFRGWICSNCNTTIGLVDENIEILKEIIKYINENRVNCWNAKDNSKPISNQAII